MVGRNEAVEALYHDLGPVLLAYARSLIREAASAEDVVHQVFLKLIAGRESLPAEPRPYLFRAVRNASLNHVRAVGRHAATRGAPPVFSAPEHLSALVPDVERALAALPSEQREVVVLRVWGGLTFDEAAGLTGVSPNTAASRYRYGLARLREHFGTQVRTSHV